MATQPVVPAPDGASSIFPNYLTRHELARGLRKTVRSIDRLILHGEAPPFVQVGNTKLFRREAVAQWLLKREWGRYKYPDDDGEEAWRFEDAPRWVIAESAGKLPDLLEILVTRTDETAKDVNKQAKETEELAKALGSLEAEFDWLRVAKEACK